MRSILTGMIKKSSTAEIRARFDADVVRFSNLETGQAATIDAPLALELITTAAMVVNPHPRRILDIGCGAGNNALALAHLCPEVDCDLVDLSAPMLERV